MHTTDRNRRRSLTIAVLVSTAVLLLSTASPASADAAPPRDPNQFACPAGSPNPFTDIGGSVHEANIRCAAAYGFINGTTSTTFGPNGAVTRGQLASFMARAVAFSGFELDISDQGFTDIAGSVHKEAINALAALGVINGTTPTTFSPDQPVTRGQLASLFARLFGLVTDLPTNPPNAFTDDNGNPHEENINILAALGIVGGVTSSTYNPNGTLTRGAAASVLARAQDFGIETGFAAPLGGFESLLGAMSGDQEAPKPGQPNAQATVELDRTSVAGMLCVTLDFDTPLSSNPTAVHVHQGDPKQAGPDVLTIPPPPSAEGVNVVCLAGLDPNVINGIYAHPEDFYVNVHTADFPDGAVRGQLSALGTEQGTNLNPGEEVPGPGEADAEGAMTLEGLADGTTICGFGFYGGAEQPMAAHIHKGKKGVAGPIVVTLPPFQDIFSDGCVGGLDPKLVADIAANPTDYYVNIHTDSHPNGAVRGQLESFHALSTTLSGSEEVPGPGDPEGAGDAHVTMIGDNRICVDIHVNGTAKPIAAHIHQAADGVAGSIVVMLPTPIFNSSNGCQDIDPALYNQLASAPEGFYVNVHTGDFPNGAVRGQLAEQPITVSALLSSSRLKR